LTVDRKDTENKPEEIKFEEALGRLEEILGVLEKGELGLEEAITHFREGSRFYKLCQERLKSAEGEVKILLEDLDGKIIEEPFNESLKK